MSTNRYAAFHRINPATVAEGFQELVDEGLLYKAAASACSSAPAPRPAARRPAGPRRAEHLEPAIEEARRLGMTEDEVLAEVHAALATATRDTNGAPR